MASAAQPNPAATDLYRIRVRQCQSSRRFLGDACVARTGCWLLPGCESVSGWAVWRHAEAWMPELSLQGCIHGVRRTAQPGSDGFVSNPGQAVSKFEAVLGRRMRRPYRMLVTAAMRVGVGLGRVAACGGMDAGTEPTGTYSWRPPHSPTRQRRICIESGSGSVKVRGGSWATACVARTGCWLLPRCESVSGWAVWRHAEAWMPELSLQGCIHGVRRTAQPGSDGFVSNPGQGSVKVRGGSWATHASPVQVIRYRRDVCCPYWMIFDTTPAPTVRPPSRIANRNPSSIAIGAINSTFIFTLSPGITISTSPGNSTFPVTSVVRK